MTLSKNDLEGTKGMHGKSRVAEFQEEGPIEIDDGWWAAVLSDERKFNIEDDQPDQIYDTDRKRLNNDGIETLVDWDFVREIFQKDEIITLSVTNYNRGGLIVSGESIYGFLPASHLINLPIDLSEDEREEYLKKYVNKNICVKIIECEPENDRIVFSERAALAKAGQRHYLLNCLEKGDIVEGGVTNITNFGVFVDLGGIEGLVHLSELSWGRVEHPSEIVNVGDTVRVMVIEVSEDKGRIALSIKQLQDNPWQDLLNRYNPGDIVEAVITSIVRYGAFARLEMGLEGLIHISSMKFPEGCRRVEEFLFVEQSVKVRILSIDPENRRLGLKLEGND
jgi:small subunit ribosomal protein S1